MDAGRGPGTSFEDFVQARSAALFRTALLLTGQNRAEAEDLLQICLERAYRHWGKITRFGDDAERYARRILVNAANDRWRRLSRRRENSLGVESRTITIPDRTAELADRDILLRALAVLPQRQRSAVVLRYFDDLDDAEIATVLGCSPSTVRSQVSRGLARLREALAEHSAGRQEGARQ
ncbi:MAG: SigE family RNA polymerase sigma factor [Nocardiopsaceae bacterium]|jgi:RNA polymerase sigma-70 factor (sigma-E family)|nr:SigE family RNA polymerase sigma factor [Nocardiopsaceae bacterium]